MIYFIIFLFILGAAMMVLSPFFLDHFSQEWMIVACLVSGFFIMAFALLLMYNHDDTVQSTYAKEHNCKYTGQYTVQTSNSVMIIGSMIYPTTSTDTNYIYMCDNGKVSLMSPDY